MSKHQKRLLRFLESHNAESVWLRHYGPVSRDAIRNDYRMARRACRKLKIRKESEQ